MTDFDKLINEVFPGMVVRKDLVKEVKGNAIVPTYVLEYLLGQYCATDDEASIEGGIDTVRKILAEHYVHRNEANSVRAEIHERGQKKVIDKIAVDFNDKKDCYEASFSNLGITKVPVMSDTVKKHPKLLSYGVWCIATVSYSFSEESGTSPWRIETLKPIQMSSFDFAEFLDKRKSFDTDQWIDLILQTIGFNPEMFSKRMKFMHLSRLIPFCERNFNTIELGPKGTGKSHIYSEFSPHGMLLSGGEVTVPKLFVNNGNGKLGLVGYWDCIAFDEFAGKEKKSDKALVDILKNYMANKSFSRGIETLNAEASLVFEGNTQHNVPYMLKHSDLCEELPKAYHDSAYLDRIHCFVPGWEFENLRTEMFAAGYGFVVDYLAEMLRYMRDLDYTGNYKKWFSLDDSLSTRDKDGVNKTFSGLLKILYPSGECTKEQVQELLEVALEGRKRVKDQILRIDSTFSKPEFKYLDMEAQKVFQIKTLEEKMYPAFYEKVSSDAMHEAVVETKETVDAGNLQSHVQSSFSEPKPLADANDLKPFHLEFPDGASGISYDRLFGKYLEGVSEISVQDPYLLTFIQLKNFMELLEVLARRKKPEDEVTVDLLTFKDRSEEGQYNQRSNLGQMQDEFAHQGIKLNYSFDETERIHARSITTDTGWKIIIDRGLDIFLKYNTRDFFSSQVGLQEARKCRAFEITAIEYDLPKTDPS